MQGYVISCSATVIAQIAILDMSIDRLNTCLDERAMNTTKFSSKEAQKLPMKKWIYIS